MSSPPHPPLACPANPNSPSPSVNLAMSPRTPSASIDQEDSSLTRYVRLILIKLDKIEQRLESINSAIGHGITSQDPEILEDFGTPLDETEQLQKASAKLRDQNYRNKMVNYLSLLGGQSPGDSVRRIMRKIGTNALWATYSLKGRKGKKRFEDLLLYEVIKEYIWQWPSRSLNTLLQRL